MKIILTSKQNIKAKTGQQYVKLSFLNIKTGESGDVFLTADQFASYNIPDASILSKENVDDVSWPIEPVDVEFNQRGRVESLTV